MGITDVLVNVPNRMIERQKAFQSSHKLVHLRASHRPAAVNAYYALFAVGTLGALWGCGRLILGKPAAS